MTEDPQQHRRRFDDNWDEFHDDLIVDWKRVRSSIEHENDLTNHRITWLLTSQGFLISAFALVFQAYTKNDVKEELRALYLYILIFMPIFGIIISLYLRLALEAAEVQREILKRWWQERIKNSNTSGNYHPSIGDDVDLQFLRAIPFSSLPLFFVLGWLVFVSVFLLDKLKEAAAIIGNEGVRMIVAISIAIPVGMLLQRKRGRDSNR